MKHWMTVAERVMTVSKKSAAIEFPKFEMRWFYNVVKEREYDPWTERTWEPGELRKTLQFRFGDGDWQDVESDGSTEAWNKL